MSPFKIIFSEIFWHFHICYGKCHMKNLWLVEFSEKVGIWTTLSESWHTNCLTLVNRVLPKSTLCMNSWWLGTAEVSYKKAHILVEVEMSSHLFFCKLKWAFLWLTSAVPNHQEFMQRVDLGKTLLDWSILLNHKEPEFWPLILICQTRPISDLKGFNSKRVYKWSALDVPRA